jgi:hypothetical protein
MCPNNSQFFAATVRDGAVVPAEVPDNDVARSHRIASHHIGDRIDHRVASHTPPFYEESFGSSLLPVGLDNRRRFLVVHGNQDVAPRSFRYQRVRLHDQSSRDRYANRSSVVTAIRGVAAYLKAKSE